MRYLVLFLALPLTLLALYNGNPSLPMMPETGVWIGKEAPLGVKIGYEGDWVYNCRLHQELHSFPKERSRSLESWTQFGVLTLNFNDRVEAFANLGTLSGHWHHSLGSGEFISYGTDPYWAWGVGGRALLAYWGELHLGVSAAYVSSSPPLTHLKVNEKRERCRGAQASFTPWQIGAGLSYRFGWFLPYVGIDYTKLAINVKRLKVLRPILPKGKVDFSNEHMFGIYLGMGIGLDRGCNLNIEWRCIQENACSASADFKF